MKLWTHFIYKGTQKYWNLLCSPTLHPLSLYTSHCDKSELTSGFLDTIKKTYVFNEKIIYTYKMITLTEYKAMSINTRLTLKSSQTVKKKC